MQLLEDEKNRDRHDISELREQNKQLEKQKHEKEKVCNEQNVQLITLTERLQGRERTSESQIETTKQL